VNRKIAAAVCLALFGALPALFSEPVVLTESSAIELALQNSLPLKTSRIELETLRRRSATSWNALLPSLSAGASLSETQDSSLSTGSPWDFSLSLSARLPLSAATPFDVRSASLQYRAAAIRLRESESALRRDVRQSFNALLLGQEKIALLQESIQSASLSADLARRNYEAGLISEVEALSAQMVLEKLTPQLEQAQADYRTGLLELQSLAGLEPGAAVQIEGTLGVPEAQPDADALVRDRLPSRPDVRAAVLDLDLRRSQRGLAAAQARAPSASLSYSLNGGSAIGSADWSGRGSATLSLSVPLDSWLPGSAGGVQVAEAGDEIAKAELALQETRRSAEVEIRSLVLKLQALAASLGVLQKNEQLTRKVYELRSAEYTAGLTELTALRQALDDHQQAGLDLATARQQYSNALADLEHATQAAP
jgi:multidrug efflux system outer membrane protein